jgi:hypothetical protein
MVVGTILEVGRSERIVNSDYEFNCDRKDFFITKIKTPY